MATRLLLGAPRRDGFSCNGLLVLSSPRTWLFPSPPDERFILCFLRPRHMTEEFVSRAWGCVEGVGVRPALPSSARSWQLVVVTLMLCVPT